MSILALLCFSHAVVAVYADNYGNNFYIKYLAQLCYMFKAMLICLPMALDPG